MVCSNHPEETTYSDSMLRAVNILVESDEQKQPGADVLGSLTSAAGYGGFLVTGGTGNGHVPRNIRLTLAAIDLVSPYIEVLTVGLVEGGGAAGGGGNKSRRGTDRPWPAPVSTPTAAALSPPPPVFLPQYDITVSSSSGSSGSSSSSSVEVGWDVGGGVTVEQQGLAVGVWDSRLPPSLFWSLWTSTPKKGTGGSTIPVSAWEGGHSPPPRLTLFFARASASVQGVWTYGTRGSCHSETHLALAAFC